MFRYGLCVDLFTVSYCKTHTVYCLPINPGLLPKVLDFSLRIFAEPQLISVLCWLKAFQIDFLVLLFSVSLCPCHLINTFSFLFFSFVPQISIIILRSTQKHSAPPLRLPQAREQNQNFILAQKDNQFLHISIDRVSK